jgi:hypothetical protein
MRTQKFLRRNAASQYLEETWGMNRAPGTLAKYAVIGGGPTFRRAGRVPLYATNDLDKWVASKLSEPMRSTSDTAAPKAKKPIVHRSLTRVANSKTVTTPQAKSRARAKAGG